MPPPYISNCFWTYPTTPTVAAGQVLGFEVVVPPPLTLAAGTIAFPVSGSSVSWSLQDTASPPNPLIPGIHYQIIDGDLDSAQLAVVFKPPASDQQIQIVPKLSLFYAGITKPELSSFTPQPFILKPVTSDAISQATTAIANALSLTTENSIIEPGDLAILNIAPKNVLDIPQVVTSILHETPEVKIRGAIPLDNIVQAFLSPVTSTFGQFVPGSKSTVNKAAQEVRSLLGGLFTIPLMIDVLGDKVTKTLAPLGAPQIPLLSVSPDAQSLSGVVPIGSWPAGFSLTSVTWEVKENGAATVYNDLSPGVNLLKSFLLRPDIVAMLTTSEFLEPTPITVTATLHINIDINPATAIDIQLPSITLQRLPLPLPQIAAVFKNAFDDVDHVADQRVYLTCDRQTAPFLSSLNDCLNLIASMSSVLNKIIAVATPLGTEWTDFLYLAAAFSVLADSIGRIPPSSENPGNIFFQPCLCEQPGPCINLSKTSWDDLISAVIAIGLPSANGFVLSDGNGTGYIAFNQSRYSSILPKLDGTFSSIQQIPPFSAVSNQPDTNFNDILEVLGYGGVSVG